MENIENVDVVVDDLRVGADASTMQDRATTQRVQHQQGIMNVAAPIQIRIPAMVAAPMSDGVSPAVRAGLSGTHRSVAGA